MVLKINWEYYLNRAEAISYVMQGYSAKWCYARWVGEEVALSLETKDGNRERYLLRAYKSNKSRTVRIRKFDIDRIFSN